MVFEIPLHFEIRDQRELSKGWFFADEPPGFEYTGIRMSDALLLHVLFQPKAFLGHAALRRARAASNSAPVAVVMGLSRP